MVTGIATAMMDSSPIVCITGQVGSKLIGSDAFQETDITGITLPITKHNYLVTRAEEVARHGARGVLHRAVRPPGPGADRHHQGRAAVVVRVRRGPRRRSCPGYRPICARRARREVEQALELIHAAKRPVILAGHGIMLSGARDAVLAFAERTDIPVAMTLLGIGGVPGVAIRSTSGMMGMHGEAWVNTAIQEADLLLALGMRFDDRVTGNVKTYAPNAKKIHVDIDPAEINKNVTVDVGLVGDLREIAARRCCRSVEPQRPQRRGSRTSTTLKGDSAVRDIQNLPDNGHLYAAHVIHDLWRETGRQGDRRHRRRPAPDVGGAVLPPRAAALAHHLGRPGHDGLRAAGGDRRQGRAARRRGVGGRRRRRLPDDDVRAGDDRPGGHQHQHRHHQQRLPRHGPPVAGVLLRAPLRRHAAASARTS